MGLDIGINVGFVLILVLAAVITVQPGAKVIADLFIVMLSVFALIFLWGGLHIWRSNVQRCKAYQFFVCQHRQGTAAFGRLLKMCLCRDDPVPRVFLDLDDDSQLYFGLVGNQTDTVIVLCTSEMLSNLRTMGQITCARLHSVDTVVVKFPELTWPSDEFFAHSGKHAEAMMYLTKYGISTEKLQETLRWLQSRTMIWLPKKLSLATVKAIALSLKGSALDATQDVFESLSGHGESEPTKDWEHCLLDFSDPQPNDICKVVVVVDSQNLEALCAAIVMKEMVEQQLSQTSEETLHILAEVDALPSGTETVVVVLSNGCFRQPHFVRQVLDGKVAHTRFVAVVVEEHFRFRSVLFFDELHQLPQTIYGEGQHVQDLSDVIENIFSKLAIFLPCHDNEDVLAVRCAGIADQITEEVARKDASRHFFRKAVEVEPTPTQLADLPAEPPEASGASGVSEALTLSEIRLVLP